MYCRDIEISLARIRSFFNHDIISPSVGSFDRYYWGWKKRDFQDSTLAYAVLPLIKGLRRLNIRQEEYYLDKCVNNIINIQHGNGSFDQCYPWENHPKVGLDIADVLAEYLSEKQNDAVYYAYKKLIDFSLIGEESYGSICNHLAHHMYEYLLAWKHFGDDKYYRKAARNMDRITELTDPVEGWHLEYLGADPGYQTRTLRYLVKCLELFYEKEQKLCSDLCERSIGFLDKVVLPDGTLYDAFGSRNTALLYPSGIEYMASVNPELYGDLCLRVRESVKRGLAIMPLQLEFDNFIRLFDDFLDAQKYYEQNRQLKKTACGLNSFDLPSYGSTMWRNGSHYIYIHYKYGGAVAIYQSEHCLTRNAGVIFEDDKGQYWGSKNLQHAPTINRMTDSTISVSTIPFKANLEELTPWKLLGLRLLNFTILRWRKVGDIFRSFLVNRMVIVAQNEQKGRLTRDITLSENAVSINDSWALPFVPRRIWQAKNLILFHMASSRYYHPTETGDPLYCVCDKCKATGENKLAIKLER